MNFGQNSVMKYRILALLSVVFLISCGGNNQSKQIQKEKEELAALDKQVMEVHDRCMPSTGEIFKKKRELKDVLPGIADSVIIRQIEQTILDLEKADEGMMDWMHHYAAPDSTLSFGERKTYYQDELNKITHVESAINQSLAKADSLIHIFNGNE